MIVTPEGLNVFPEDVERVLTRVPGVRDAAVVGARIGTEERVHAVLVLDPGADVDAIVRQANAELGDHQKIRRALVWPEPELPRTEGTRKLKRALDSRLGEGRRHAAARDGGAPTGSPRFWRSTRAATICRRPPRSKSSASARSNASS